MNQDKEITLGEFLRHERESRGITIEQVASTTKVGVRTLHALEADHYAELPAKPFIRGFVTSYSRFIGLDAHEVLSRFDRFLNVKTKERPSRDAGHSGYAFEKKDGDQQSRTWLMIIMGGFISVGGILLIFFKPVLGRHKKSGLDQLKIAHETTLPPVATQAETIAPVASPTLVNPLPTPSVMTQIPKVVAVSEVSEIQEASPAPLNSPSASRLAGSDPSDPLDSGLNLNPKDVHHKMTFKMLEDNWVRFRVDQRPIRKFVVRKNKVLVLRAKNQVTFQASHPEAISFSYNSRGFQPLSQAKEGWMHQQDWTIQLPRQSLEESLLKEKALPKYIGPPVEAKPQPDLSTSNP